MILRAACLTAALLITTAASADQAACKALHEAAPEASAGFALQERHAYADPAAGFAAQYDTTQGARLSVFHYLGGETPPKAQDVPALMRVEMGRIVAFHRSRGLTPTPAFRIKLSDTGNPSAAEQGFREVPDIRDITVLGVASGCLVKLRYTGPWLERDTLLRLWHAASTL